MTEQFQHFFKPEVRSSAEELISAKAVYLKVGTDTQIEASIRGSTPVQVTFRSPSIESADFTVDCSCKSSAKGQMCKHIWATLLVASEKQPDFFSMKSSLQKGEVFAERVAAKAAAVSPEALKRQRHFEERDAALKQRAADARKQQYQIQKARAKERQGEKPKGTFGKAKEKPASKSQQFLSEDVTNALKYFEANGFPLSLPIDEEELNNAKRILARVFHPDKGGSQDEVVELLRYSDILLKHR